MEFIWLRPFLVSSEQSSIFSLTFIVQGNIVFQKHSLSQGRARWCSACAWRRSCWRRTSTRENTWSWGRSWRGGRQGTLSGGVRRAQSRHYTLALLHLYHQVLQSCPSFASWGTLCRILFQISLSLRWSIRYRWDIVGRRSHRNSSFHSETKQLWFLSGKLIFNVSWYPSLFFLFPR